MFKVFYKTSTGKSCERNFPEINTAYAFYKAKTAVTEENTRERITSVSLYDGDCGICACRTLVLYATEFYLDLLEKVIKVECPEENGQVGALYREPDLLVLYFGTTYTRERIMEFMWVLTWMGLIRYDSEANGFWIEWA